MENITMQNAEILNCYLGFSEMSHGCYSWGIDFRYQAGGQSFYRRANLEEIRRFMRIIGVSEWSELKGKFCRVQQHDTGILSVGHFLEDEWYDLNS